MLILLPLLQFGVVLYVLLESVVGVHEVYVHRLPADGIFVAVGLKVHFQRLLLVGTS